MDITRLFRRGGGNLHVPSPANCIPVYRLQPIGLIILFVNGEDDQFAGSYEYGFARLVGYTGYRW